eukprot:scaffold489_cov286-Prasinococcus_capsulatus_cf.AAC.4
MMRRRRRRRRRMLERTTTEPNPDASRAPAVRGGRPPPLRGAGHQSISPSIHQQAARHAGPAATGWIGEVPRPCSSPGAAPQGLAAPDRAIVAAGADRIG